MKLSGGIYLLIVLKKRQKIRINGIKNISGIAVTKKFYHL